MAITPLLRSNPSGPAVLKSATCIAAWIPTNAGSGGSANPVIHWPLEFVVTEKIGMAVARSTSTVHPDPST